MGLHAEDPGDGGTQFEIPPQQIHQAVCSAVYDIGTHDDPRFGRKRKVLVFFEMPHCRLEFEKDGEEFNLPAVRHVSYNLTLGKKANLRRDLEMWFGKKFEEPADGSKIRVDLEKLLGKNCQVQIMHVAGQKEGKPVTYANISSVMMPAEGQKLVAEGDLNFFSFEDFPEKDIPASCPQWVREKILASDEYMAHVAANPNAGESTGGGDDDIPF
jgi:hypothetical protein